MTSSILLKPVLAVASAIAYVLAWPLRRNAHMREPAIADPASLRPGDAPPTGGRLLLLYDGGCGICLHARDLFARWDGGRRLADDRIARHDSGLLSGMTEETRYATWHVVHPDGRIESGGDGLAALFGALPGAQPLAFLLRRMPSASNGFYTWFKDNRDWISQSTGLTEHPQRDQREQAGEPGHELVTI